MSKICSNLNCQHGGTEQPLSNFYKDKKVKSGLSAKCKDCRKMDGLEYRKTHKDQIKKYKEDNRDKAKVYNHQWEIDHKDERTLYHNEYNKNNKERTQRYKENNKEKVKETSEKFWSSPAKYALTYFKLEGIEEIRKDPKDERLIQVKCSYDGNWFNPTARQVRTRTRVIDGKHTGGGYFYCSEECKEACPVYGVSLWPKGFKSKASAREVNPQFRKMILERDNFTCQECETPKSELNVPLHVHHIIPFSVDPILDCDLDNGICLCKTCHIKIHMTPGCTFQELYCKTEDIV